MTGNEIRQRFLDYFKANDHQTVRSSSLVPADDPTLLFTNAGMVQFKRTFLGEEKRAYTRATTSQKCVRAGGKHNDLENVGYTARHHTFFEMLGNFSFGDYFKDEAIAMAWELITEGYGLNPDTLWVSVYLDDDEAYRIWNDKVGVPADRIVRLGESENFWAMGDTGPCGPCSEIHVDRGDAHGCGESDCGVDCDCDRFLEIWNLVFMQFNRDADGNMTPLPKPSIDTGMGLERMASILQNVDTNYDTDLLTPIMNKAAELSGTTLGQSEAGDVAMKVIADHSRAAAFLVGDGVMPSNEGRGYVLRRILRRAIRYGRQIGLTQPFLHDTAAVVFDIMQPAYPELAESAAFITNVIRNEEERFSETLDFGLRVLSESLAEIKANGETRVPGHLIFKLYDTFGFPVDIVRDVVRDEGMDLDMDGFEADMAKQRAQSRSKVTFAGISDAYKSLTADGFTSEFVGYGVIESSARVRQLVMDAAAVPSASANARVELVTDQTPFYGESGGQVGDQGVFTGDGFAVRIDTTRKDPTGLIIHEGEVTEGTISSESAGALKVDAAARRATACNHTATHILHAVLKEVLGDHVKQAGSMVAPDRLRFDFSHFSQIEPEVLVRIETAVNDRIRANQVVGVDEMSADEAIASGATALFEEKYGDRVRVVHLGDYSRELCGGTHVTRSGDIGLFKIVTEASVAAGVRRIEALTGTAAVDHVQRVDDQMMTIGRMLKEKPDGLADRIARLQADAKQAEKTIAGLKTKLTMQTSDSSAAKELTLKGETVLVQQVDADSPVALREISDRFRDKLGNGVVVLGANVEGKAMLVVQVSKDLTRVFHAGNIVKALAAEVGGGGGGRPDMAQAGGPNGEQLGAALEKVEAIINSM